MPNPIQEVSITEAALRLGLSYHQTQRLVLIGRLKGGRGASGWYVDAESLASELRARAPQGDDSPRAA